MSEHKKKDKKEKKEKVRDDSVTKEDKKKYKNQINASKDIIKKIEMRNQKIRRANGQRRRRSRAAVLQSFQSCM